MKGVAYQAGVSGAQSGNDSVSTSYQDPLAVDDCKRDIPILAELGANTIRTYALDPTADHDDCMALLDQYNIYLITDLSEPSNSINRNDPQWNTALYERYTSVIDAMAPYTNTLGFFAGNEVSNNISNTNSAAYVKAAVRDMKAYIKSQNYRSIGVGYAADDDAQVRDQMIDYMNCGNTDDSIDFWGYNIYEWCGDSSFTESGYDTRVKEFANYSVPAFFAEYGCNTQGGAAKRPFTEVESLYGSDMNDVFSGGIVFEYFEEDNDYGLVSAVDSSSVSTLADFTSLSKQLASATPTGVNSDSFNPTNTAARDCPTVKAAFWDSAENLPPTPNQDVCTCQVNTLKCKVKSGTSNDTIGALFGEVCGLNSKACASISGNTTTGTFGAFSMCTAEDQLSIALNAYYLSQNSASDACDFGGNATLSSGTPSAAESCSSLLSSATSAASSGSSATGSSTKSGKKSDASLVGPSLGVGKFWIGGYVSTVVLCVGGLWFL